MVKKVESLSAKKRKAEAQRRRKLVLTNSRIKRMRVAPGK